MYEQFYGLAEAPFNLTPDSRFLFLSDQHREAMATLLFGIQERKGFLCLTGEVGSGKTMLCRALLNELRDRQVKTAVVFNAYLSAVELLRTINDEFAIPSQLESKKDLIDQLNLFLIEQSRAGNTAVLVVDEAQNLPLETLEQIRMLSNLESETEKLLQIVLVGQPQLNNTLAREDQEQLAQRISVRYHIQPLREEDILPYIRHRLSVAQAKAPIDFTDKAVAKIAAFSGGIPRKINLLCDRCLLIGYVANKLTIEGAMVQQAIKEVGAQGAGRPEAPSAGRSSPQGTAYIRHSPSRFGAYAALAAVVFLVVVAGWLGMQRLSSPPKPKATVARATPAAMATPQPTLSAIERLRNRTPAALKAEPAAAAPESVSHEGGPAGEAGQEPDLLPPAPKPAKAEAAAWVASPAVTVFAGWVATPARTVVVRTAAPGLDELPAKSLKPAPTPSPSPTPAPASRVADASLVAEAPPKAESARAKGDSIGQAETRSASAVPVIASPGVIKRHRSESPEAPAAEPAPALPKQPPSTPTAAAPTPAPPPILASAENSASPKRPPGNESGAPGAGSISPAREPVAAQTGQSVLQARQSEPQAQTLVDRAAEPSAKSWVYDEDRIVRVDDPQFSLTAAVLTAARLWNLLIDLSVFREASPPQLRSLDIFAVVQRQLDIRCCDLGVDLGAAFRFDLPMILALKPDGEGESPYLVAAGMHNGGLALADPLRGRRHMPLRDILPRLQGIRVLYRDADNLRDLKMGESGERVRRLQEFLVMGGWFVGQRTGTFDQATAEALGRLQDFYGIPRTCRLDDWTCLLIASRRLPQRPRLLASG